MPTRPAAPISSSRPAGSQQGTAGPRYAESRRALLARPGFAGAARRRALTGLTDGWLSELFATASAGADTGMTLLAVGGYGRRELSPGSDLDLVLLHDSRRDAAEVASRVWYPVWDSGVRLDHAMRTPEEARRLAGTDLAVLLGLLDSRPVAGDARLAGALRSAVLGDWRAAAPRRLPQLQQACRERAERHGEVAYSLEPDLKAGRGGLRDVAALRAVAASWVADRPHGGLDNAAVRLLDVRDELHLVTGRCQDRLLLQEQDAVAARLGRPDADALLAEVGLAARTVAYAGDLTWRRVEAIMRATRGRGRRLRGARRGPGPVLRPVAPGLLEHEGEVVLGPDTSPATDPVLALRVAATAAREGLALGPATLDRLAAEAPPLPHPWPPAAREALVALLGAGPAAVPLWEALDQAGLVVRALPEWTLVRGRPQRNAVHRFTVDRHLIETAANAAARTRRVSRPDLLLLAALLHDLGKGCPGEDHSVAGARLARILLARMGLPAPDVDTVATLVREHLLLVDTATRRDLDDPATVASVVSAVRSAPALELLHALTESDALATGPGAWSTWRAGLVAELVRRTAGLLRGELPPPAAPLGAAQRHLVDEVEAGRTGRTDGADTRPLAVHLQSEADGWTITVVAADRQGLLAAVAGVLALHRLSVRSATVRTVARPGGPLGVDTWSVVSEYGDPPALAALREDVRRALDGALDVAALLARRHAARAGSRPTSARRTAPAPPRVDVVADASSSATVLEVRAEDRPGLLHRLGSALAAAGVAIRSARVNTLGAEAVDVFYVVDEQGHPLAPERLRALVATLEVAAADWH